MKQRLIRILVYEGEPEFIQQVMQERGVKGSYVLPRGGLIKEAIVGDFLEAIIDEPKVENDDAKR